jgi:hypothetical protein
MDPAYHARLLEHATAIADLDGAVVELQVHQDDPDDPDNITLTADVRIPAPQSAIDAYQEASNEIHYLTGD